MPLSAIKQLTALLPFFILDLILYLLLVTSLANITINRESAQETVNIEIRN